MSRRAGLEPRKERVFIPCDLELLQVPCDIDQGENQEEVSRRAEKLPIWLEIFLARAERRDWACLPSRRVSGDTNGEPTVHQAGTGPVMLVISLRFLNP